METIKEKHKDLINELGGAWIVSDGQIFPPNETGKQNAFSYSLKSTPRLKVEFVEPDQQSEIKPKKKLKNGIK